MSRKRSSPQVESEEEDDDQQRKQPRIQDDDGEEEEPPPPAEVMSPSTNRNTNAPGRPAEAGVIKRVYVENFMCHRKLTVDLCRNVNFIYGQNGSGKSAVLAAIQICLGAGARRTHRARNLRELVRKEAGEHATGAKVRVTLLNGGPDGFQPDVYGETITVERTISLRAGGSNGYKLLDHSGKEQSRSKKDLDAMLDQLNIQVENPVAVLDQEEAKKFLTGKSEDKYEFFTKATELERIDRSYASVIDNLRDLNTTKESVELSLETKKQSVHKLKKEWEQYQELDKLEDKVLDLQVDYAWAFYTGVQSDVDGAEQTLAQFQAKREKRLQELSQVESQSGPQDQQDAKQEVLDQLIEEARVAADTKKSLEAELKRAGAPVKAKERQLVSLKREEGHALRSLQNAKNALQEERAKILASSKHSDEARRAATLKESEEELEKTKSTLLELKQSCTLNQRKYEELDPSVEQSKSQVDSIKSQMGGIAHKIRQLESSDADSLAMFGRACQKVDSLVKRARWTGPVVGPIGAHLKIARGKEEFAGIAEQALGNGTLDRFVVTNDRDRRQFQEIRKQAGCSSRECGVYQIGNGPRYKLASPPAGVETVATCLNIADDVVFNALVDHCRMDQRALGKSKQASEEALLIREGGGKFSIRGGNIKEVYYLPHGDRWKITNGSLSLVSNDRKLKQTLGVDKTAAIAGLRSEHEQLEQELRESSAQHARLAKELKQYKICWNNDRKEIRNASHRIETLNETIARVQAETEEAANVTVDTSELEEDVVKAEQVVAALKEQETNLQREKQELEPAVEEVQRKLEEVTARNEKVLSDMNAAERDLESYLQNMTQREAQLDKKRNKVHQMQEIISKHEEHVQKLSADRDSALRKARVLQYRRNIAKSKSEEQANDNDDNYMSPSATAESTVEPLEDDLLAIEPVTMRKDPAYYRSKIERAQDRIKKEKQRRRLTESDPQVALEKYLRAQKDLDASMSQLEKIDKNVDLLTDDVKARKKKWKQFRKHIVDATNITFNELLNRKGSCGELEFDHNDRTLDLVVQKDSSQESSQTKDVKALSGGERSFTTLSLLLALGERLETPFRVMDEFDVFLDPVARKLALETLLEIAKSMSHRQFIFITPQDLSSLTTDPQLKIFHLKPPARDQRVGGPSQQTLNFGSQS